MRQLHSFVDISLDDLRKPDKLKKYDQVQMSRLLNASTRKQLAYNKIIYSPLIG